MCKWRLQRIADRLRSLMCRLGRRAAPARSAVPDDDLDFDFDVEAEIRQLRTQSDRTQLPASTAIVPAIEPFLSPLARLPSDRLYAGETAGVEISLTWKPSLRYGSQDLSLILKTYDPARKMMYNKSVSLVAELASEQTQRAGEEARLCRHACLPTISRRDWQNTESARASISTSLRSRAQEHCRPPPASSK